MFSILYLKVPIGTFVSNTLLITENFFGKLFGSTTNKKKKN